MIFIYFNFFLLLFNIFVLKKYFEILLTGLPTDHIHRYILERWKRITENITTTINSLMKLQMIFYRWYVIFIDKYTDGQIKTPTELHMVFRQLYDKLHEGNTNGMKQVKFFGTLCLSVNSLINLLLMNSPTDYKLQTRVFSMDYFRPWVHW